MQRARWVAAGLALLLVACAATPARHFAMSDPDDDDYDANKVDSVTQWAHIHGATVVWVNYPTKHRPREIGTPSSSTDSH